MVQIYLLNTFSSRTFFKQKRHDIWQTFCISAVPLRGFSCSAARSQGFWLHYVWRRKYPRSSTNYKVYRSYSTCKWLAKESKNPRRGFGPSCLPLLAAGSKNPQRLFGSRLRYLPPDLKIRSECKNRGSVNFHYNFFVCYQYTCTSIFVKGNIALKRLRELLARICMYKYDANC